MISENTSKLKLSTTESIDNFRKSHFWGLVIWRLPHPHCASLSLPNAIAREGWGLGDIAVFLVIICNGGGKTECGGVCNEKND